MVKVENPNEPISLYQTTGGSIVLRKRKEGYTVSKNFVNRNQPEEAQALVKIIGEARHAEWRGLTNEQREQWITLALNNMQTGFQLYLQEGWKKYLQSIYGFARYDQQVYMP